MTKSLRTSVHLVINGKPYDICGEHAFMMLADYLRYEQGLTGTKIVCAEGDCGACTVLCWRNSADKPAQFLAINACIAMVGLLDGCHIVTVEGLKRDGVLTEVQQAIVNHHGSQCGYCTPGFVMAMTAMFEKPRACLSEQKIKNCLTGNLCRCTGYSSLIEAALSIDAPAQKPLAERFVNETLVGAINAHLSKPVHIIDDARELYAPLTIADAHAYRQKNPRAKVVTGATDFSVLINKNKLAPESLVSLHLIRDIDTITEVDARIIVGARVSLSELRAYMKDKSPVFASFLNIFASPQIKNMATLVGNVANGSPIADTIPFLMVADGKIHSIDKNGEQITPISELYVGYKKLALDPSAIITHISFAPTHENQILKLEKVSQRKDLDISTVNLACLFDVNKNGSVIDSRLAVGGVAASAIRLSNVESYLKGKFLTDQTIADACNLIKQQITPLDDLRGSAQYRRMLVDGLFRRVCHGVINHEY